MAFPLPRDPKFILEVVEAWIEDIDERLNLNDLKGANESWRTATKLFLSLPPGSSCLQTETKLFEQRVKLDRQNDN